MYIQRLRLLSFRAHAESELDFSPKINLIHGSNGAGKTNVLEAIHYLALSKSFLASSDQYALQKGAPYFEIEAGFEGIHRKALNVRLVYVPTEGKRIFVNKSPLDRLADIVGQVPLVVFSPSDHALTAEGPDVRRRFLNNILSQSRPVYLDDLLQYRRVLKQRNVLLAGYRKTRSLSRDVLASWDAELCRLGSRIITTRIRFTKQFKAYLADAYARIAAVGETPGLTYKTIAGFDDEVDDDEVALTFERRLAQVGRRELEMGRSLVGPHRDELEFRLDDLEVRRYASQGQHQTFGMALKLAQFFYLEAQLDETPLLLLDDLFGNLDPKRTRILLEMLQSDAVGQCLITAAQRDPFDANVPFDRAENQSICIAAGQVQENAA